jgi:hypothetical protein
MHPLFNLYSDWRKLILIIDLPNVSYRYIDDLMYLEHRQNPGDDALKNEWLAECGLELHHAVTHGVIQGVTAAALSAVMVPGAEFQPAVSGSEQPALAAGSPGQPMPTPAAKRPAQAS